MTDAIRTPDELFAGLPGFPFSPHWRQYDGLRLAHLDEGDGAPVLFLHGEPTWYSYDRHTDAGHFLQDNAGPQTGGLIADWLRA